MQKTCNQMQLQKILTKASHAASRKLAFILESIALREDTIAIKRTLSELPFIPTSTCSVQIQTQQLFFQVTSLQLDKSRRPPHDR